MVNKTFDLLHERDAGYNMRTVKKKLLAYSYNDYAVFYKTGKSSNVIYFMLSLSHENTLL